MEMKFLHSTRRLVHCQSEQQAHVVQEALARRLEECKLELHPDKTRIVYCKDANREDISRIFNPILRVWNEYYGQYHPNRHRVPFFQKICNTQSFDANDIVALDNHE